MTKSATEVMQEIVFAAVVDAIVALKAASKGVPNTLLRDLNAVHANTAFEDLPEALRETMPASVRAAFTRLLKEGYSVSPGRPAPAAPPPRRDPRLRALRASVRGAVLVPPGAAYDQARLLYQERFDGIHPLAVVQAASLADVAATVRWAARTRVP
ncbi:MAG: hypothetical protein JO109_07965, partial [Alphaproteobacteria bacterium]|nr:hypothetical protein [Alphaproteobacteria bacterium]